VKPDAAHDVDRYRKDAESDGGVSAEMRAAAAKVDAIIGSADLTKFARLVEDSPADAMMLTMMVMVANAQRGSLCDLTIRGGADTTTRVTAACAEHGAEVLHFDAPMPDAQAAAVIDRMRPHAWRLS
jgi:hypothetical protein